MDGQADSYRYAQTHLKMNEDKAIKQKYKDNTEYSNIVHCQAMIVAQIIEVFMLDTDPQKKSNFHTG